MAVATAKAGHRKFCELSYGSGESALVGFSTKAQVATRASSLEQRVQVPVRLALSTEVSIKARPQSTWAPSAANIGEKPCLQVPFLAAADRRDARCSWQVCEEHIATRHSRGKAPCRRFHYDGGPPQHVVRPTYSFTQSLRFGAANGTGNGVVGGR